MKEQAKLLLGRLRLLGDGALMQGRRGGEGGQEQHSSRWRWLVRLEVEVVRERQAQAVGFLQGRSIRRLGFGRLDV